MSSTPTTPVPAAFSRKHAVRAVSGFATAGLMVGVSLAGASSASAATDADCNVGNTVDATAAGTPADIQTLMDADTAVICLSGTFVLATSLNYDYDLTLHGLTDGVLDGNASTRILDDIGSNTLTVENLRLTNGNDFDGGAIYGSIVIVHDSQFDNNEGWVGGAIAADEVEIYDSLFFDNYSNITGGAVTAFSSIYVEGSTLRNNVAEEEGGAIASYGVAYSDSSTFEGNESGREGGAISANRDVEIQNSTFVENSVVPGGSGLGGAIYSDGGNIYQSTFVDNTASTDQGQTLSTDSGTFSLRGNIFAGSNGNAHVGSNAGTYLDLGANLFSTSEAAESELVPAAPSSKFELTTAAIFAGAVLADNGGPTQTVALSLGSPALSAVPADASSMTVDQRGVARPAISDAGAFEYDNSLGSGDGDGSALAETGSEPSGWLVGTAGLLLVAGITVLAIVRRRTRRLTP